MSFSGNDVLLRLEHVSKRFQLGEFVGLGAALRAIKRMIFHPLSYWADRATNSPAHQRYEGSPDNRYIWALRDVSFELRRGERVAILGRNGAGKSTLLKVLVGITMPSEGSVSSHCRIVPLMGVGAGFNPELTGRENVFVYGGLLGVPASEITSRYDEIVAFAEIPEFMDTPVKRYSKGMRARLGMAVALNLAPQVLVIDEVLAVGDVSFKSKCMQRMEGLCNQGMTLLFVSHSPARVKALCNRAILLRQGCVVADGDVDSVLQTYLREDVPLEGAKEPVVKVGKTAQPKRMFLPHARWPLDCAPGDDVVRITMIRVVDGDGRDAQLVKITDPIYLEMEYVVHQDAYVLRPRFQIFDEHSALVFATIDTQIPWRDECRAAGVYRSRACIPGNLLGPHKFLVGGGVFSHRPLRKHAISGEAVSFQVCDVSDIGTAQSDYSRTLRGYFRPLLAWQTDCAAVEMPIIDEHV